MTSRNKRCPEGVDGKISIAEARRRLGIQVPPGRGQRPPWRPKSAAAPMITKVAGAGSGQRQESVAAKSARALPSAAGPDGRFGVAGPAGGASRASYCPRSHS